MNEAVTKAVILAAGRGTRMGDLTLTMPKPMVEVCGKPVLSYILEGLRDAGVQDILIVVGYRKDVVMNHFRDGSALGVKIVYIEQITQDGTGKVVELAKDFCGSDYFILSYGDILVDPSSYHLLTRPGDADLILTVRPTDDASKGGAVYLNEKFEVIDLREKQRAGEASTPWYNAGVYTFKSTIFSYIARLEKSPRGEYELTDAVSAMAREGKKVKAVEIKGSWADVGDPETLSALNIRPPGAGRYRR
jgi:UDP-N-acetylglucosamine diphosphorylase / glucose-1-phosphate thymidylyltransferase / UDP-N-acetylgalactosamine diphosphorylase / glucosamine-1-phosphate N-acetyltransferase / galactosamine-1-phosphate N-acetyltransferase